MKTALILIAKDMKEYHYVNHHILSLPPYEYMLKELVDFDYRLLVVDENSDLTNDLFKTFLYKTKTLDGFKLIKEFINMPVDRFLFLKAALPTIKQDDIYKVLDSNSPFGVIYVGEEQAGMIIDKKFFLNTSEKRAERIILDGYTMLNDKDYSSLAKIQKTIQKEVNESLMKNDIIIEDPDNTYISRYSQIGPGTIIRPNTHILGRCVIGRDNIIGPNTYLNNVRLQHRNIVDSSWIDDAIIGCENKIGPFSKIYGHSYIANRNFIGNFVEIKNTGIASDVHAQHLSYLGDANVGEATNIGCMSATANFDSYKKHQTIIGNNVFVGTGSVLIAPVVLEDDSFVAAGSVITDNVKKDELAIARSRQTNKEHGSSKLKEKKAKQ